MLNHLLVIATLGMLPATFTGSDSRPATVQVDDSPVVAVVNGHPFELDAFRMEYVDHLLATGMTDSPRLRKAFLDQHVRKMLVVENFRNPAILQSDAYQAEKSRVERKLLIEGLLVAEVYSRIEITEADLREMFVRINTSVSASHLYAPTAESAATLHKRLLAGESFESLAAETFSDSVLANNGGSIGYFEFDEMDPAFEDAAHQLDIGQISAPVRTSQGYSIIRVDDRFVKPILTESEYVNRKDRLKAYVTVRKRQQARREFLNQIAEVLEIELHRETITALFAELNGANVTAGEMPALETGTPLASTTTGVITVGHVLEEATYTGDELRSQIRSVEKLEAFVRGVAIRRAIVRTATENGVDRTTAFKTALSAAMDEWLYEQAWNEWKSTITIDDSAVVSYFEEHGHEMIDAERMPVWEIIVADEDVAAALAAEATLQNFERLAILHSIRPGADHSHGYLGELAHHELGAVADIIFNATENSIVGPVPVGGRYAIFRVGQKIAARPAPFDRVEQDIRQILAHDKLRELVNTEVDSLLSQADVQINSDVLFGFELRSTAVAGITND